MECIYLSCKNPASDSVTCEDCSIPKYCSETCRSLDLARHKSSCTPHIYSLREFIPVKTTQKLGSGAYGEVQLVQHKNTHSLFAQKIYKKSTLSSLIPLKVLFREISVHQTLIHPNIVRLYDHMEDHIKLYLIMEYVEKGTLFDLLHKKGRLSEREAWDIFTQTCVGLHYLHSKNILHRDLKPENLLISKENVVKICDFGWSAQGTDNRVTFCGTLDYMSPEMLNKQLQTYKVDVWAVGVLLYEMLHAAPPFRGKNPMAMARLISERNFTIGNHVSNSAKVLISELLQENPENRPSILQVLKTQWVKDLAPGRIRPGFRVSVTGLGEGVVESVEGLVAVVNFAGNRAELIENDLVREKVEDENGEVVFGEDVKRIEGSGKSGAKTGSRSLRNMKVGNEEKGGAEGTKSQKNLEKPVSSAVEEVKSQKNLASKSNFEFINLAPAPASKKPVAKKSLFLQKFKDSSK